MESTLKKQVNEAVQKIHEGKINHILREYPELQEQDFELKKVQIISFLSLLLRDESLNLYKTQDMIILALVFWNKDDVLVEQRIQTLLAEPVQKSHFNHFQKQFGTFKLAYEFILGSIYVALSNNWILKEAYGDVMEEINKASHEDDLIELPVRERQTEGLRKVLT